MKTTIGNAKVLTSKEEVVDTPFSDESVLWKKVAKPRRNVTRPVIK